MHEGPVMRDLKRLVRSATRAARQIAGIPDYETYVERRKVTHPDEPIMSFEEFHRAREDARCAVGEWKFGRFRCC